MARKAPIITLEEFKAICRKRLMKDGETVSPYEDDFPKKIMDDISKIQFDWENYELIVSEREEESQNKYYPNSELGYKVLSNGLPVLFCHAGGDWEWPVNFIIYWDGKNLRGYIPEEGNMFDKKYRTAYGSQGDTDLWAKEKHDFDDYPEEPEEDLSDIKVMEQDIIKRIQIVKDDK